MVRVLLGQLSGLVDYLEDLNEKKKDLREAMWGSFEALMVDVYTIDEYHEMYSLYYVTERAVLILRTVIRWPWFFVVSVFKRHWLIPPIFQVAVTSEGAGPEWPLVWQQRVTELCLWTEVSFESDQSELKKPVFITMRRRSSSNASRRSSTIRRRSENLRFDEFGFALTKRKDQKLHHRCHDYRCGSGHLLTELTAT